MADGEQSIQALRKQFSDAVVDSGAYLGDHWVEVRSEDLPEVATWLRDDPSTQFALLLDVTAVHWPEREPSMELVYHLYSVEKNERLRLKTRAGDAGPVPSLSGIWKSAAWNERETYDMFGIRFEGHPDLRRILMPDDYTDFPLRKEFPLYRG